MRLSRGKKTNTWRRKCPCRGVVCRCGQRAWRSIVTVETVCTCAPCSPFLTHLAGLSDTAALPNYLHVNNLRKRQYTEPANGWWEPTMAQRDLKQSATEPAWWSAVRPEWVGSSPRDLIFPVLRRWWHGGDTARRSAAAPASVGRVCARRESLARAMRPASSAPAAAPSLGARRQKTDLHVAEPTHVRSCSPAPSLRSQRAKQYRWIRKLVIALRVYFIETVICNRNCFRFWTGFVVVFTDFWMASF